MNFTAHKIITDSGIIGAGRLIHDHPWFLSARNFLNLLYPTPGTLADLGCLEGGYSVELARMGWDVTGYEVRESNYKNCLYLADKANLQNLTFVNANAWDIDKHYDVIFCCGLFYHVADPRKFMQLLRDHCNVLILNTHFATAGSKFNLSGPELHEGLTGYWYHEGEPRNESSKWASWDNKESFWLIKDELTGLLQQHWSNVYEHHTDQIIEDRAIFLCW